MKKPVVIAILAADVVLLGAGGTLLYQRLHSGKAPEESGSSTDFIPVSETPPSASQEPPPAPPEIKRRILFSLPSSKAAEIAIAGDFTDWKPQPLTKGRDNKTWSVVIELPPGIYTYNYIIDGRKIKDPNNSRGTPDGKSILTVKGSS